MPEEYNKYKLAFVDFCPSLEGLYATITKDDLKRIPAFVVLDMDSHHGLGLGVVNDNFKLFVKTILKESPDFIITYNDIATDLTKLSLLLGIYKMRVQDDDPSHIKWKASYIFDAASPLTTISSVSFNSSTFQFNKKFQEILDSDEIKNYPTKNLWQCSSFMIQNKLGIKDTALCDKDIDIVFIGGGGDITLENAYECLMQNLSHELTEDILKDLYTAISGLAISWDCKETKVFKDIFSKYEITEDKVNKAMSVIIVALSSIRRVEVLKGLIKRFGDKYKIKIYGNASFAKSVSKAHYGGMVYGPNKEDVFRRSKIQVYTHSYFLSYTPSRILESYRYSCACISNYIVSGDIFSAQAMLSECVSVVPKFKNMQELFDICEYYVENTSKRLELIDTVLSVIPKEVDVSEKINAYIRFFDYAKGRNVNPFEVEQLRYDSKVIYLCGVIEECYKELGLKDKAEYFAGLKRYFVDVLEAGYKNNADHALQYALYCLDEKNDVTKAIETIDTYCRGHEKAMILKGQIMGKIRDFNKAIEILSSFTCTSAENECERLWYMAGAYANIGNLQEALNNYLKIKEINYKFLNINFHIGCVYLSMKDYHKAIESLSTNTYMHKTFYPAYELLGDIYLFALGDMDNAINNYLIAVEIVKHRQDEKRTTTAANLLQKVAIAYLYKKDFSKAGGALNRIIEEFDSRHVNAHVKLFLILAITNTLTGDLWERELSFIKDKQIDIKAVYNKIRGDFPPDITSIIDKALSAC